MSWDVLLQRFPDKTVRPEDLPDDYLPPAVGSRSEVASAIRKLFRNVDYASDSSITIERAAFTMEINLGDDEPCSQLLLNVHGDHAQATKAILRLADHFEMRALDCSTTEFMETGRSEPKRAASKKSREVEARAQPMLDHHAENPVPPLEWLSGVVKGPVDRYVYMSILPGESPVQQQKAMFRHWIDLTRAQGEMAGLSGPSYLLTLPDGEAFGDFHIRRYPSLTTETQEQFIPLVQEGADIAHAFAAATGRRSGEIEDGSVFVDNGGQRYPLAKCAYRKLLTDADYARKIKSK